MGDQTKVSIKHGNQILTLKCKNICILKHKNTWEISSLHLIQKTRSTLHGGELRAYQYKK